MLVVCLAGTVPVATGPEAGMEALAAPSPHRFVDVAASAALYAVEAGRLARGAGRIPRATTARASSPVTGLVGR